MHIVALRRTIRIMSRINPERSDSPAFHLPATALARLRQDPDEEEEDEEEDDRKKEEDDDDDDDEDEGDEDNEGYSE